MIRDLMVVGTRVETTNHQSDTTVGEREICNISPSMFALKDMDGNIKWCRFPVASQYEIDGDTITIWQGTEKLLTYKIL
jgi:hypothetical protein